MKGSLYTSVSPDGHCTSVSPDGRCTRVSPGGHSGPMCRCGGPADPGAARTADDEPDPATSSINRTGEGSPVHRTREERWRD